MHKLCSSLYMYSHPTCTRSLPLLVIHRSISDRLLVMTGSKCIPVLIEQSYSGRTQHRSDYNRSLSITTIDGRPGSC